MVYNQARRSAQVQKLAQNNISNSSSISSSSESSIESLSSITKSSQSTNTSSQTTSSETLQPQTPNSTVSTNQNESKCNQPVSPDLVKTENGCFGIVYYTPIFKNSLLSLEQNQDLLFDTFPNKQLIQQLTTDYFNKVKFKIVTKNPKIAILEIKKRSSLEFEIILSSIDLEYFEQNSLQYTQLNNRYTSNYSIYQEPNGTWSYKFIDYVKDQNGNPINQ